MEIGYFDVSCFIVYTLAIIFIPTFIFRLLRAFPYYVKNGDLGNDDYTLMYDSWFELETWKHAFTHPNPTSIVTDALVIFAATAGLWMAWIVIPIILLIAGIVITIIFAAKRARERYLNKQRFVEKLKGDNV